MSDRRNFLKTSVLSLAGVAFMGLFKEKEAEAASKTTPSTVEVIEFKDNGEKIGPK